jgi:flagellar basal body-associated protein FliL
MDRKPSYDHRQKSFDDVLTWYNNYKKKNQNDTTDKKQTKSKKSFIIIYILIGILVLALFYWLFFIYSKSKGNTKLESTKNPIDILQVLDNRKYNIEPI